MATTKDIFVKNEIVNSAQLLFKQFGLKKTTMDEIAAACGKAKSTLYHYFKSKEEVFDEVLDKELRNIRQAVNESVEQQTTLKGKLHEYFVTFHQEAINKMNLFRILKQELKIELTDGARFHKIIAFETSFVAVIINEGFEKGEFTGIEKEEISWFAEIMVVAFLGIVRYSIEKEGEFDVEKLHKVTDVLISRVIA
jgi:AcrR family transcriptional regulator